MWICSRSSGVNWIFLKLKLLLSREATCKVLVRIEVGNFDLLSSTIFVSHEMKILRCYVEVSDIWNIERVLNASYRIAGNFEEYFLVINSNWAPIAKGKTNNKNAIFDYNCADQLPFCLKMLFLVSFFRYALCLSLKFATKTVLEAFLSTVLATVSK